jgi:hypothetical protein
MVGEGEGGIPELHGPRHQRLGERGAIEEGERRVTVQLDVRRGRGERGSHGLRNIPE